MNISNLYFSKEEMMSFLIKRGYVINKVRVDNTSYDEKWDDPSSEKVDLTIAHYQDEDINLTVGSYHVDSKYGLENQFYKELKRSFLDL